MRKVWWKRRRAADAPEDMDDVAWTVRGAWAQGWNDAIRAYVEEVDEAWRKEFG